MRLFITRFVFILISLFVLVQNKGIAQKYTITGSAYDLETGETLPFVNVYLPGTTAGAITDLDGNYEITTQTKADTIAASFLGYETVKLPLRPSPVQTINFYLPRSAISLEEIVIRPLENPAHVLLRKIIENKPKNNPANVERYTAEAYNKIEVDLNELSQKFVNRKTLRPFKFVFENIDTTDDGKLFLPVFLTETLSEVYHQKTPNLRREVIKATRMSGAENESVSQLLGNMYQNYNVYDNYINMLKIGFLSPIADNGLNHYNYYLLDSFSNNGHAFYRMQFVPKRPVDPLFSGEMLVVDGDFALKEILLNSGKDVNINFVTRLNAHQVFEKVNNSWVMTKDNLDIWFKTPDNLISLIGRKSTSFSSYQMPEEMPMIFNSRQDVSKIGPVVRNEESFWLLHRHDSLSVREKFIYDMVDSLKEIPAFRTYLKVVQTLFTGLYTAGPLDFGPYIKTYSFNMVEGHRLRMGVFTNENLSKKFRIGGYGAYGLGDRKWKYGAMAQIIFENSPRQEITLNFSDDVTTSTDNRIEFSQDNLFSGLYRRSYRDTASVRNLIPQKMIHLRNYDIAYRKEWPVGYSNQISFSHREITPYFPFAYKKNNESISGGDSLRHAVTSAEINFKLRFAWQEKFLAGDFNRISLGSRYPIAQFQYTLGLKGIFGSDFYYQKIVASLSDNIPVQPIGTFSYILSGGAVFGNVPLVLLEVHKGNETWFFNPFTFNMMNEYEFVSDRFASLFLTHSFDGFFLNKIPGVRKLKMREAIHLRALYGTMTQENRDFNSYNQFLTPSHIPYLEAGAGLRNIFTVFSAEFLWRLTYRDQPFTQNWSIRAGLNFQF